MIRVDELSKTFQGRGPGEFVALDRVSFHVEAGEIYGLLGPNGAGKTTCLRVLSTVLRPTGGSARVAGFDVVREAAEVRARIGFMSGNTGIYDRMTAWELVAYFGRLHGMQGESLQERMETIFKWLQLNDIRDVLGSKMSTGMRQKVSIARTIIHDPPVLIFDEPTNGLDVLVARAVLESIARLREEGKCIIFSTHVMREVEKLCDRVGIIDQGRILAEGTLPELVERYDEPDVEAIFFRLIDQARGEVERQGTANEEDQKSLRN